MKIGIINFHWGTNYGGVIQAYALQELLRNFGADVEIINYAPRTFRDSFLRCFRTKNPKAMYQNIKDYFKEQNFKPFRRKYLLTTRRYYTLDELQKDAPKMDIYISGSDQVWNPYIVNSYGMPYFLPFGDDSIKRIAFAVSFACTTYPVIAMKRVKSYIDRFQAISVREDTGLIILKGIGIDKVKLMPDPTLLLKVDDLNRIVSSQRKEPNDFAFFYILQNNQGLIQQLHNFIRHVEKIKIISSADLKSYTMSVEEWLGNIRDAQFIVTNSYHGAIFSILFHKQFVLIPIEGKLNAMNDRIYTLLRKFDLSDRIIETFNKIIFNQIVNKPIDWAAIQIIQKELYADAYTFLHNNICGLLSE